MTKKRRDVLTPIVAGHFDLADKGNLIFRKQILPLGTINYNGQKIPFDRAYHRSLIEAFNAKALDQTSFLLANEANEHHMDPERVRGTVVEMSTERPGEKPGLYAHIQFPSKKAAKAVMGNPGLGVSCRIQEGRKRADGKTFSRAVVHVLGTLDPRVTGMEPWKTVSLSGYDSRRKVLDLTREEFAMPKKSKKAVEVETEPLDLSQLAAQIEEMDEKELRSFLRETLDLSAPAEDDSDDEDEDDTEDDDDIVKDEADSDDEDDDEETDLSFAAQHQIDLANATAQEARDAAQTALQQLADERWLTEQEKLLRAGVPKAIVDLAEPILHTASRQVLDLSNGTRLDVTSRMRKILTQMVGFIELSSVKGHSLDLANEGGGLNAAEKSTLEAWESAYGS